MNAVALALGERMACTAENYLTLETRRRHMQVMPWLKPAFWGVIVGAVSTMIVGFSWLGWVLGGTADRMALERANAAVVLALTPSCVSRFMQQPNATAKLKELQAIDSWKQREFVEAGGWATASGDKTPNSSVASACAEQLLKAKG